MFEEWDVRIFNIEWGTPDLSKYVWLCDSCGACLSEQEGFDTECGTWECKECGYINDIDEYNLDEDLPEDEVITVYCEHDRAIDEAVRELERKCGREIASYSAEIIGDCENDEDEENDNSPFEDDFELADFCRGGDLTED